MAGVSRDATRSRRLRVLARCSLGLSADVTDYADCECVLRRCRFGALPVNCAWFVQDYPPMNATGGLAAGRYTHGAQPLCWLRSLSYPQISQIANRPCAVSDTGRYRFFELRLIRAARGWRTSFARQRMVGATFIDDSVARHGRAYLAIKSLTTRFQRTGPR